MFRLNETYLTKAGYDARIICVNANASYAGKTCNIVALISSSPANAVPYLYDDSGKLYGVGNATHDLISNEPNAEEAALIREIDDYCERQTDDRGEKLLKIIRQLRKK